MSPDRDAIGVGAANLVQCLFRTTGPV